MFCFLTLQFYIVSVEHHLFNHRQTPTQLPSSFSPIYSHSISHHFAHPILHLSPLLPSLLFCNLSIYINGRYNPSFHLRFPFHPRTFLFRIRGAWHAKRRLQEHGQETTRVSLRRNCPYSWVWARGYPSQES